MKTLRIPFIVLCVLALSALSAHAAQLASAKVLKVEGTVSKYAPDGSNTPLKAGDILTEGDSISATALSSAFLVFSNGSEITVNENTSFSISKLEQSTFSGSQSYEQLQADPSQSQTLLELNYGELGFHVKKLQAGSTFNIETPLGTAAIRGTQGTVKLYYNAELGEFILIVTNDDGLVDFIGLSDNIAESIPQNQEYIIRLHRGDPLFDDLFKAYKNYIPTEPTPGDLPLPTPIFTPDDEGVIIVSPEDQG